MNSLLLKRTAKTLISRIEAQADLSLRWAQRSFCWFCRAQANFFIIIIYLLAFSIRLCTVLPFFAIGHVHVYFVLPFFATGHVHACFVNNLKGDPLEIQHPKLYAALLQLFF